MSQKVSLTHDRTADSMRDVTVWGSPIYCGCLASRNPQWHDSTPSSLIQSPKLESGWGAAWICYNLRTQGQFNGNNRRGSSLFPHVVTPECFLHVCQSLYRVTQLLWFISYLRFLKCIKQVFSSADTEIVCVCTCRYRMSNQTPRPQKDRQQWYDFTQAWFNCGPM